MADDAPEAAGTEVQPPSDPRQAAIAEATVELGRGFGEVPEASPADGTAASPEATEETGDGEPAAETPAAVEPDWSDPTVRESELKKATEAALKRQLATFKGQLQQSEAQQKREALLAELDELEQNDPEGWAERIKRDAEALEAVKSRVEQVTPALLAVAQQKAVEHQVPMMYAARPEMAEFTQEQWDEVTAREGGVFAYIAERSAQDAVDKFKKSPEFKTEIEKAEKRGARNATGELGSPPPSDDAKPPSTPAVTYDDPKQAAVAEAMRALGRTDIDPSQVGRRRAGARR